MPLGDSITAGWTNGGPNSVTSGYRGPLYNDLTGRAARYNTSAATAATPRLRTSPLNETYHEGHGGYTSTEILSDLSTWLSTTVRRVFCPIINCPK